MMLTPIIDFLSRFSSIEKHIVAQQGVRAAYTPDVAYSHPKNFVSFPAPIRQIFDEFIKRPAALPARCLLRFRKVAVSWHGIIFSNFNIYVPSLVYPSLAKDYRGRFLFRQWLGPHTTTRTTQEVGLVYHQWAAINYYHWILEALPKLLILQKYCPNCTLVLPNPLPDFIRETVALFGYKNYILLNAKQTLLADTLLWPERMGDYWLQDAGLLHELKENILAAYGLERVVAHRKIYASRAKAHYRRIINEEDILYLVREEGFEVVFFEELTFREQVTIMAEAAVIIGIHGANLTNLIFMNSGGSLIELVNEQCINLAYFKLANYCAIDYYCLLCENYGTMVDNNSDIVVKSEEVSKLLQQISSSFK